jgi:hypothetical protein
MAMQNQLSTNVSTLSPRNQSYLAMMQDIYEVSLACSTKTYLWGGFTIDIFRGAITREHGDIDGFTENMLARLDELIEAYTARGYQTEYIASFQMLKISKGDLHAGFNRLDLDGDIAMWRHIGDEGTVYFPKGWLDSAPRDFYHVKVYTSGIRFEYAIKTKVAMLTPIWQPREKDLAAIAYLEECMAVNDIQPEDVYRWVWSYNPFWYKRGYEAFFRPMVAYPLPPK